MLMLDLFNAVLFLVSKFILLLGKVLMLDLFNAVLFWFLNLFILLLRREKKC